MLKGVGGILVIFTGAVIGGMVGCVIGMIAGPVKMFDMFDMSMPELPCHKSDQKIKDQI